MTSPSDVLKAWERKSKPVHPHPRLAAAEFKRVLEMGPPPPIRVRALVPCPVRRRGFVFWGRCGGGPTELRIDRVTIEALKEGRDDLER